MPQSRILEDTILQGKEKEATDVAKDLLATGTEVRELLKANRVGMRRSFEKWSEGEYSTADVLVSIDAFRAVKDLLINNAIAADLFPVGRILVGTIAGNVHQIGKALVSALLESEGFEVFDLGENVPRQTFLAKVAELHPDILMLACYTLNAQNELKALLLEINKSGLRSDLKIIIGGHSTSQGFADSIGVDAWAANLLDTAAKVNNLMRSK